MVNARGIPARKRYWRSRLLCLTSSIAVIAGNAIAAAPATPSAGATTVAAAANAADKARLTTYSIVNLDPGDSSEPPVINAGNQVAFSTRHGRAVHAGFFDGDIVHEIGSPGGADALALSLNDMGQVAGDATNGDGTMLGFRWSETGGLVPLGKLDTAVVTRALAINRYGQVIGMGSGNRLFEPARALAWNETGEVRDLGALGNGSSVAHAINDAGMIAGASDIADGFAHAFVWTEADGMRDLGTLAGVDAYYARLINNAGQVAGYSGVPGAQYRAHHGFVWSQAAGMVDIGTLGGATSFPRAMNEAGQVAGFSHLAGGEQHAMAWSREGGIVDLGTLGGNVSEAVAINSRGDVVGWASTGADNANVMRAFVWSKAHGMADLNQRIAQAPAGLTLTAALAISERGAIVADSNAGMLLLTPGGGGTDAPLIGPMSPEGPVLAGEAVTFAATFSDRNVDDTHSALWSWNDGCAGPPSASKVQHAGTVRAGHTFCAAGVYWVTLKVTDSNGRSTTVGREVVVYDYVPARAVAAGGGWFMSPQGATMKEKTYAGRATFGFAAGSATKATRRGHKMTLKFRVAKLDFESAAYDTLTVTGSRAQYQGSGMLNGAGKYRFMLSAVDGAARQGRLRMKIWHADAGTGAEVVDYDNQVASGAAAVGSEGSAIAGGSIVVRK